MTAIFSNPMWLHAAGIQGSMSTAMSDYPKTAIAGIVIVVLIVGIVLWQLPDIYKTIRMHWM